MSTGIFADSGNRRASNRASETKKVRPPWARPRFAKLIKKCQGATMASVGQEEMQAPQSTQLAGSIHRAPFFSLIAPVGHSPSQAPQLTQASVILCAMIVPLKIGFIRIISSAEFHGNTGGFSLRSGNPPPALPLCQAALEPPPRIAWASSSHIPPRFWQFAAVVW